MDEIETDIENAFLNFQKSTDYNQKRGNGIWTIEIRTLLAKLGDQRNYWIATPGWEGGWLYDLVWYEKDEAGNLTRVPLVMECEWDLKLTGIKYDFEKLLLANAEHRLMICEAHPDNIEKWLAYFTSAIQTYKNGNKGDRFMIVILNSDSLEFEFHLMQRD